MGDLRVELELLAAAPYRTAGMSTTIATPPKPMETRDSRGGAS
jgi:hypothetical protein